MPRPRLWFLCTRLWLWIVDYVRARTGTRTGTRTRTGTGTRTGTRTGTGTDSTDHYTQGTARTYHSST